MFLHQSYHKYNYFVETQILYPKYYKSKSSTIGLKILLLKVRLEKGRGQTKLEAFKMVERAIL